MVHEHAAGLKDLLDSPHRDVHARKHEHRLYLGRLAGVDACDAGDGAHLAAAEFVRERLYPAFADWLETIPA